HLVPPSSSTAPSSSPPTVALLFELYDPPARPLRHAFPTRRSSDLPQVELLDEECDLPFRPLRRVAEREMLEPVALEEAVEPVRRHLGPLVHGSASATRCRERAGRGAGGLVRRDRKSTRLNSSHRTI